MLIGIDACAVVGGGATYLRGILGRARPEAFGITGIRLWAQRSLLEELPDPPWLEKVGSEAFERGRFRRMLWQRFSLRQNLEGCDLLWTIGGFVLVDFSPFVIAPHNSLLYDLHEAKRYGMSAMYLRLRWLRRKQLNAIPRAAGLVFLTDWGEQLVRQSAEFSVPTCVVPHGIDEAFLSEPRRQKALSEYSMERPMKLVYVSIIDVYKHQWHVARAVAELRRRGLPLEIHFVGPAYGPALRLLETVIAELDPERRFLHYTGPKPYDSLPALYRESEICVFASTCENLPNVLLEAMGAAIPIACSNRSPMREVIGDGGELFDPESPESIAGALGRMAESPEIRARHAARARELAESYSWQRCSDDTLRYLAEVSRANQRRGFR